MTGRRQAAAVALLLLAFLGVAGAAAGEPVLLRLTGRPGESFRQLVSVNIEVLVTPADAPASKARMATEIKLIQKTDVEAASADGRLTLRQRITGIHMGTRIGDQRKEFDSRDPRQREAARSDKDLSKILALMDAGVKTQLEPTGALRSYESASGEVPEIENELLQALVLFPSAPVSVGEHWSGGTKQRQLAGAGTLEITLDYFLLGVDVVAGERIASIGRRGTATLRADEESGAQAALKAYKENAFYRFSLDRGHLVRALVTADTTLAITDADGPAEIRTSTSMDLSELR